MALFSSIPSMNSIRTENMNSFHPGAHASCYYGDGNGRDYGIVRSAGQLCGTSAGNMVATSHDVGLPNIPAPVETERGHPPGYTGHVPGRDESYGETYALRTARFNSPRDDGTRRTCPNMARFSTSASAIGAEREMLDEITDEDLIVPPLVLTQHKNTEELEADALLTQNPPRVIAPKSQRFTTRDGYSEAQIDLVRRLDSLAESHNDILSQMGELVIINIPGAAKLLNRTEERLRGTALSLKAARLIREDNGTGPYSGVAVPQTSWETALNLALSS